MDIGTSQLKASLIDERGKAIQTSTCVWGYQHEQDDLQALFFRPEDLVEKLSEITCIFTGEKIEATIVSAQRLGIVFLDANNNAIYGIPNIDRRASMSMDYQNDSFERYYQITGRWVGAQYVPGRMKWLKSRRPELLKKTKKIVSLSDWLSFYLCGVLASDTITAGETGCFDISRQKWSDEIIEEQELEDTLFCDVVRPDHVLGRTTSEKLGIPKGVPVCVGSSDTSFGIVGAKAISVEDMVIVAGSSAPINTLVSKPLLDSKQRTVTNPFFMEGIWSVEANAMMTGLAFTWGASLLFGKAGKQEYDELQQLGLIAFKKGFSQIVSFPGVGIADSRHGNLRPTSYVIGRTRDLMSGNFDRPAFAASLFESVVFSILGNVELLEQVANIVPNKSLAIGGGETKFALLLDMLATASGRVLTVTNDVDLTSLGAAMVAFTDIKWFGSLQEACSKMQNTRQVQASGNLKGWDYAQHKDAWMKAFFSMYQPKG